MVIFKYFSPVFLGEWVHKVPHVIIQESDLTVCVRFLYLLGLYLGHAKSLQLCLTL